MAVGLEVAGETIKEENEIGINRQNLSFLKSGVAGAKHRLLRFPFHERGTPSGHLNLPATDNL